jgi:hypothetical protein
MSDNIEELHKKCVDLSIRLSFTERKYRDELEELDSYIGRLENQIPQNEYDNREWVTHAMSYELDKDLTRKYDVIRLEQILDILNDIYERVNAMNNPSSLRLEFFNKCSIEAD